MSTPEVKITSLSHGGSGVGRIDDLVVFVPFTAPGDRVKIRIKSIKKNYAEGELVEILESSPHRIEPRCKVFGQCGGCQWQHVSYEEQLLQKQKIVENNLLRIAKEEGVEIKKIIPSPQQWHYRNRAQVQVLGSQAGFYAKGSHKIIEFDQCHIIDSSVNSQIQEFKSAVRRSPIQNETRKEFRLNKDRGFSQVNSMQNLNLQNHISKLVGLPEKSKKLLDLYCGNGNFSLNLIEQGWQIHGIDNNRSAIEQAKKAISEKALYEAGDVVHRVQNLSKDKQSFEVVILDPPRIGAEEPLWKPLTQLNPTKIIYVSCNAATFARDWARLKRTGQFKLQSVTPFDMFPQTFHVELVAFIVGVC